MKILVGISGASGVNLGLNLLEKLENLANCVKNNNSFSRDQNLNSILQKNENLNAKNPLLELFCVITKGAKISFEAENAQEKNSLKKLCSKFKNIRFFDDFDLSAPVASGSFGVQKTIIAPCSLNTLAKINAGFADTLLTRAAGVALKEKKTLILGVREMPFSTLALEQMTNLSRFGAIIAPPVLASYSRAKSLEQAQDFIIGKWLDALGISHGIYTRWGSFS